jgi:hypothetical protein
VKLRSYLLCILFYVKTSNKSPMMVAVCSTWRSPLCQQGQLCHQCEWRR